MVSDGRVAATGAGDTTIRAVDAVVESSTAKVVAHPTAERDVVVLEVRAADGDPMGDGETAVTRVRVDVSDMLTVLNAADGSVLGRLLGRVVSSVRLDGRSSRWLDDVDDGAGCSEVWEAACERRQNGGERR